MKSLASNVRSVLQSAPEVGPLEKLRRGSILFEQKQDACGLFLIESGLVKLIRTSIDDRNLILSVIGPHQLVGEESLAQVLDTYVADVVCLTDVLGYHIPSNAARRLFGIPEIATAILNYMILRDQERIKRIEMLSVYDVQHRLLHGLAELAQLVKPSADGSAYPIPMTHVELASFVGATRETTSMTLSTLRNRRLVTISRRLVTTVSPKILIDAANDRLANTKKV